MYSNIGLPGQGVAMIGLVLMSALISAALASSVHLKLLVRLSNMYSGRAFSPSREINWLKEAVQPASHWTCLSSVGISNRASALILLVFALIHHGTQ